MTVGGRDVAASLASSPANGGGQRTPQSSPFTLRPDADEHPQPHLRALKIRRPRGHQGSSPCSGTRPFGMQTNPTHTKETGRDSDPSPHFLAVLLELGTYGTQERSEIAADE
jgi:hypothetical protein